MLSPTCAVLRVWRSSRQALPAACAGCARRWLPARARWGDCRGGAGGGAGTSGSSGRDGGKSGILIDDREWIVDQTSLDGTAEPLRSAVPMRLNPEHIHLISGA